MSRSPVGAPRFPRRLLRVAAAATLVLVAGSCDKVPLLAPTSSTITLSINRTTLPVNGTAEVTATVIESAGTSVQNGTLVTFVTNLGTFDPPEAETRGGRATVTFHAGTRSGTALLSASSGGNRAADVEVLVGGAAAEHVVVLTDPTSVPVTGGIVQVTAVVTDSSGNPLPGAPLVFSSDNGTLSSSSGVTDASGEARVSLTTNRETIVRASVAGKEGTATVRAISLPLITISVPAAAVTAGTPVAFTLATPAPPTGATANPIVSLSVDFGDGNTVQLSPGSTSVTHAYGSAGTYTATARAVDSSGLVGTSSTSVVVLSQGGLDVTLSFMPNPATAGEIVTFSATVTGAANIVSYKWNFGDNTGADGTSSTIQHRYSGAAFYNAEVTVTATDGRTGTGTRIVQVVP